MWQGPFSTLVNERDRKEFVFEVNQQSQWTYDNGRKVLVRVLGAGSYNVVIEVLDTKRPGRKVALRIGNPTSKVDEVREDVMLDMAMETTPSFGPMVYSVGRNPYFLSLRLQDWIIDSASEQNTASVLWLRKITTHLSITEMRLYDASLNKFMEMYKQHQHFSKLYQVVDSSKVIDDLITKLKKMHAQGIVHCDLAPRNIVCIVDSKRKVILELDIIDFGLAMFNDRLAEPRFELSEMRMRLTYMQEMIFLFTPAGSVETPSTENVVENITMLDNWVIEILERAKQTRLKFEAQKQYWEPSFFATYFKKTKQPEFTSPADEARTSRERRQATPNVPLPKRPSAPPPPPPVVLRKSDNVWPFSQKRLSDIFPIYNTVGLFDEGDVHRTDRNRLYRGFRLITHPDKWVMYATEDKELEALEQECEECHGLEEDEKTKRIAEIIAARKGSYAAAKDVTTRLSEFQKRVVTDLEYRDSLLASKIDRPDPFDESFFEKILQEKIDDFNTKFPLVA